MSCPAPFNSFRQHIESFCDEIYKTPAPQTVLYELIPRAEFPQGEGLTRSVFTIGRSLPTDDEPEFQAVELVQDDAYTGACSTTYNQVNVGFRESTYNPEKFGWRGITICSDDLIYSHKVDSFLGAYIPAMAKNTKQTIDYRFQAIYDHFVPKAVANADFGFGDPGTGAPGRRPNLTLDESECELSQQMLDRTAEELNEIGAFEDPMNDGWFSLGDEGPVYPLMIGQAASQRILLNSPERRQDYRFAFEGAKDLAPVVRRIGASKVIGNFRHMVVTNPPRYTYDGTKYVRVPTYIADPVTKGYDTIINPAWKVAPYEGVRVLSPSVWTSEIIRPVNSAAGLNWPVKNYMGEWEFVVGGNNIGEEHCLDPMNKLGAHFAEFDHAPRPVKPTYGRLIIFRRCPGTDFECATCTYS